MKNKRIVLQRRLFLQRGVTLIELMVSMTIGLLILAGVVYIFSGTRKSYDYNEILARVQENGRFAINILNNDLRMTGYFGCGRVQRYDFRGSSGFVVPDALFTDDTFNIFKDNLFKDITLSGGVGAGADDAANVALASSDTLTVTRTGAAFPVKSMNSEGKITISGEASIDAVNAGDTLVISNCKTANVFEVGAVSHGSNEITPTSVSVTQDKFGREAYVMTVAQNQYSVRNTDRTNRSGQRIRALFRNNTELVEGVESMKIKYGVDADEDGNVDDESFQEGASNTKWDRVIAVQIDLLVASTEDGVLTESQPYTYQGTAVTPTDRKMRQAFSTTVALRNRIY